MNIGTLIAFAARRVFEDGEQRLGVRLSPVTLSAEELNAAVKELRALLGPKAYIVGSAPKVVAASLDDRAFVAPDQRAAERATQWRNLVKVAARERLVYVSVESHAKANGLRDCLEQLRERDLRDAFKVWASGKGGLPRKLLDALDESGLLGAVRLSTLCEFAERVASASGKEAAGWQAAGESLPILNLARDSRLGKDDPAERLRANHALVRALETGEGRRRTAAGPLAEVEDALLATLSKPPKGGRRAALATVDLGVLKTPALTRGKAAKPKAAPVEVKPTRGSKSGDKGAATTKKGAAEAAAPTRRDPPPELRFVPPTETPGTPIEAVLRGEAHPSTPLEANDPTRAPVAGADTAKAPPRLVRLTGAALPLGLAALLTKLLDGSGEPVELSAKAADRALLREVPKTLTPTTREARRARDRVTPTFTAWSSARRAVLDSVRAIPAAPPLADALTRGLPSLLKDAAFSSSLSTLVDAAAGLYDAAGESDERTMREVLALDTVALRGLDGAVALRVIGPLHLLSIGQALLASRTLEASRDLPEAARRLMARAMEVAPPAPGELPDESAELPLARGEAGLLTYERVPELVSAADAAAAARVVVARYLSLCPHALLGLRVAVTGDGDLGSLVDGVAQAVLEASPRPERAEVLCAMPPAFQARSLTARALEDGALTLGALDEAGARGAHVTLRLAGTRRRPEDDEAAAPSVKAFAPPGGDRTTFELRASGLRVFTSVSGARELAAVEALTARAMGRLPCGAFVMNVAGRSLRAECEGAASDGAWLAIVGRSLGRRPPPPWLLIAHEGVGAHTTCAVVSRDLRAAARSLQEALAPLGVSDMRPRSLLLLAERLAGAARSSLVPLGRPAASLVVSGLLALELRRVIGDEDALIAPVTGAVYETLLGKAPDDDGDTLQIAAGRAGGGIRFVVGYATASEAPDLDASKTQLDGAIARRVARVLDAIQAAGEGARPDAAAAREAIAWALWSAVAADDAARGDWREELSRWVGATGAPTEVVLLTRPAEATAKDRAGKIGRAKAAVRPLALERLNAMLLGPK